MITNKMITETLKCILDDRNWSINRLAKESGVPQSTINSMIKGKEHYLPSTYTLQKICEALGITISEFYQIVESAPKKGISAEDYRVLGLLHKLSKEQRKALIDFLEAM